MKKLLMAIVTLCVIGTSARADGIPSPFYKSPGNRKLFFMKHPVPAFQAAPWYSYWPYQSHFQSAAPLGGPFMGGGMVNPYFQTHGMPGGH